MQQNNKPNYPTPSYEGLYFYEEDANQKPVAKGYVKRLLPNGRYIVATRHYALTSLTNHYYREFNLEKEYLGKCRFFTDEADFEDTLAEAMLAAEDRANDEVEINPDTGEIVGFDELEQRKAKPKRMAKDTITNGKKRLVKVTDNFPKRSTNKRA